MNIKRKITTNIAIISANILGGISLSLFGWFLFYGPPLSLNLSLSMSSLVFWNSALCLIFFIQHSLMIRNSFRRIAMTKLPAHFHGWIYTIASALVIFVLVIFWQSSELTILQAGGGWRLLLRGIFMVGAVGIVWSVLSLNSFDAFGTGMLRAHVKQVKTVSSPLAFKGPYKFVRHPIYFFILIMIWSYPDLTLDRLIFNSLFSFWMVLATFWEENDLKEEFGEEYRHYQKMVPMLIPWKLSTWIDN